MILGLRGARDRELALRMKCALAPDRIDDDRRRPFDAEHLDRRIELARVDESAHTEVPTCIALAIRANRLVAVTAGREISPVRRRNFFLRDRLEVEDVERFVRGGDEVRVLRCLL